MGKLRPYVKGHTGKNEFDAIEGGEGTCQARWKQLLKNDHWGHHHCRVLLPPPRIKPFLAVLK